MAKRNNRADFDDFDDYTPAGYSTYNSRSNDRDSERPDLDDWADDLPRSRQKITRRHRKSHWGRWVAAVAVLSIICVLAQFMLRPDYEDELPYQEDTEPADITTQYEPIHTEPPETYFPTVTQPQLPPVTQPPVTQPPVTEPPITQPPVTQPPATEPPQTEPPATEPQATGVQLLLQQEAQVISEKYGVTILVGDQCDTVYSHFVADIIKDQDKVVACLNMLDYVLSRYPAGFFRQLCSGQYSDFRIQLVSNLYANKDDLQGDGYAAFAQDMLDHYILIVDVDDAYETLFYHEIGHIIDYHLTHDAASRPDALFSQDVWNSLNPSWFAGYSEDYMNLPNLQEQGWFVDSYGAVNAGEDKAQIMAEAMKHDNEGYFLTRPGLWTKLDYFSRCIRDAFDTTGWPATTLWEQVLE